MDQMFLLSMPLSQLCWSVSLDLQYHFIDKKMSWSEAQSHCRKYYTDLASVNDMKDLKNLKAAADGRTDAWIELKTNSGLTDRKWHWSQPTVTYKKENASWDLPIEPNDAGEKEKCVIINSKDLWNDISCEETRSCFVCYNESTNTTVMIEDSVTWLEAQRFCRTNHTDLMSGPDQQKQFVSQKPSRPPCWIGLFQHTWSWSDGSESSFRNWNSTNSLNPNDECAVLVDDGRWESVNCGRNKNFICHGGNFVLVKEKKTWEEALVHCRVHYLEMAWSIDTEPWKTQARNEIRKANSEFVWVGLHFACYFEEWFWVDGNYVSATNENWNKPGGGECGHVAAVKTEDKKWHMKNLGNKYNFICLRSRPCNG